MDIHEQLLEVTLPSTSIRMLLVQPFLEFETLLFKNPFLSVRRVSNDCRTRSMRSSNALLHIDRM